jgi:hypothetical protein
MKETNVSETGNWIKLKRFHWSTQITGTDTRKLQHSVEAALQHLDRDLQQMPKYSENVDQF